MNTNTGELRHFKDDLSEKDRKRELGLNDNWTEIRIGKLNDNWTEIRIGKLIGFDDLYFRVDSVDIENQRVLLRPIPKSEAFR